MDQRSEKYIRDKLVQKRKSIVSRLLLPSSASLLTFFSYILICILKNETDYSLASMLKKMNKGLFVYFF